MDVRVVLGNISKHLGKDVGVTQGLHSELLEHWRSRECVQLL